MPHDPPDQAAERLAVACASSLARVAQALETASHRHLAASHLTVTQFAVLRLLLSEGSCSQRYLGQKLQRSGGNLTLVIDNLERDGMVTRTRDLSDRRVRQIRLTEQGRALTERLLPQHQQGLRDLLAPLTPGEQQLLCHLADRLNAALTHGE